MFAERQYWIADYAITGDVNEVIPKMIKYYKQNSK